jgi:hypothetical protein
LYCFSTFQGVKTVTPKKGLFFCFSISQNIVYSSDESYLLLDVLCGSSIVNPQSAFSKHGQVRGFFNKEFIKTGVFPKEFGRLFNTVFEYRQKFDYVDLIIPEKELLSDYISKANIFIQKMSEFIKNQSQSL